MKTYVNTCLLFVATFIFSACEKSFIDPQTPNTPETNFDALWQEYDRLYGQFKVKQVDWNALYKQYRPRVNAGTTDRELLTVMGEMLDHLNDNHIYVRPTLDTGLPYYNGGLLGRRKFEDFSTKVVDKYLLEKKKYGNDIEYGWLPGNIGYLSLLGFSNDFNYYPEAMDMVLGELKEAKGIVIELRNNGGGEDRVAQYIVNRFATCKHLSFTSRLRSGPNHRDFGPEIRFYTEPAGSFQYTRPVVVLTRRQTYSSGETFVLGMKQVPHAMMVGDSTGGAFSDAIRRELPNGWLYRVPIADVRDAEGKSHEGVGLAPSVLVQNKKEEIEAGKDRALEKAIEILSR